MADKKLLAEMDERLGFQIKWRRITSGLYFTSTALAIVSSAAATAVAGMGYAVWGSVLAGSATILLGLEKALLLREKWAHHLNIASQLDGLKLEYLHGNINTKEAVTRMGLIFAEYAAKLPMAPRGKR